ncbi:hypothetical protein SAMN05660350_00248 [Geodermatophilus obscurus]|uniref:Uncharacterized protein n=1 Tax=Geodermatophilus obscurus TaxID=1861 RepID=A0A1M7RYG0_9ACTN|nr:hypothetical protein SAMN05660350_00248 [Geodermatophilus obscurus]
MCPSVATSPSCARPQVRPGVHLHPVSAGAAQSECPTTSCDPWTRGPWPSRRRPRTCQALGRSVARNREVTDRLAGRPLCARDRWRSGHRSRSAHHGEEAVDQPPGCAGSPVQHRCHQSLALGLAEQIQPPGPGQFLDHPRAHRVLPMSYGQRGTGGRQARWRGPPEAPTPVRGEPGAAAVVPAPAMLGSPPPGQQWQTCPVPKRYCQDPVSGPDRRRRPRGDGDSARGDHRWSARGHQRPAGEPHRPTGPPAHRPTGAAAAMAGERAMAARADRPVSSGQRTSSPAVTRAASRGSLSPSRSALGEPVSRSHRVRRRLDQDGRSAWPVPNRSL